MFVFFIICIENMKKNYSITRPTGHKGQQFLPTSCPNIQLPDAFNILKDGTTRDRNIAGQISTKVVLEDKSGNRMTFHQKQQVINTVNGCKNSFYVSDNGGYTPNRRKNYVRRKN